MQLRKNASRTHGPRPDRQSIPCRCCRPARSTPAPQGKCRRDERGPASNKCRCNPCIGSSVRWPALRKRDRSARPCQSLWRGHVRLPRRELPKRSLRRAADSRQGRSRRNRGENASLDRSRLARGAHTAGQRPERDILAVTVSFGAAIDFVADKEFLLMVSP